MKRILAIVLALAVFAVIPALAQQGPRAVLEYFDNASGDLLMKLADGSEVPGDSFDIGMDVPVGATIVTFDGDSAEVRLQPNGSIIKIAANTNFLVEGLQGAGGADANRFAVAVGKIRNVAARATGNDRYVVRGASTVAGVRGTDWGMEVLPGQRERAFTLKGLIDFTNAAGQTIQLAAGKIADGLASTFEALELTQDLMNEILGDLQFLQLNPDEVPGQAEETPEETTTETAVVETPPDEGEGDTPPPPEIPPPAEIVESAFMTWLRDVLGMEIGSITIGDDVFSKAVLQPTFEVGKLKLSLYLPIIYRSNMFDPNDWYHPEGNDEWSFGTDQPGSYDVNGDWVQTPVEDAQDVLAVVGDVLGDLFLKIRYIQIGEQRDTFFLKVGNLNNITIGSGFIMRDFANDAEFPSVRRVGLNFGIDGEKVGFEVMANDLAKFPPEIFGGRFYLKPFGNFAVGLGAVADINPSGVLATPAFFHFGFNMDFPIVRSDALSFILFADIASSMPYFAEDYTYTNYDTGLPETVSAGLHTEALLDPDAVAPIPGFKNWGFAAGVMGNIFIVDYRVEFRYFTGSFRPAYFDTGYERERPQRVYEVAYYLNHMNDAGYANVTMGIYGEGGFSLLDEKILFVAGYMWPWTPGVPLDDDANLWPDDYLKLQFSIAKGVIPVLGLSGSITFERSRFAPLLAGGDGDIFDANSLAKLEVIYPVAPIMDLALTVTATAERDVNGNLVISDLPPLPNLKPSVAIEMRMDL
jgi:hypothetical protein